MAERDDGRDEKQFERPPKKYANWPTAASAIREPEPFEEMRHGAGHHQDMHVTHGVLHRMGTDHRKTQTDRHRVDEQPGDIG